MKQKIDWKSCLDTLTAKDVKPDEDMIKSLIKMSKNKLLSEEKLEMSDVTAASKLSLAYDSLRELLEALALKKGYKIYNHECFTAFLKEVIKQSDKGDEFDDILVKHAQGNAVRFIQKARSVFDIQ
ncbi:hypothetical protein HYZ41_02445 [archaeon]|nr:hypothetical protein [archaeon]